MPTDTTHLTQQQLAELADLRSRAYGAQRTTNTDGFDENVTKPADLLDKDVEELSKRYAQNLQIDWNAFNLKDLNNALGENTQELLDSIQRGLEAVKPFIDLIVQAIELSALFIQLGADLIAEALKAVVLLVEVFVDLISSTGLHFTRYVPTLNTKTWLSTREVLFKIADSYDDVYDEERPISRSSSDTHLFWGAFVSAPNIDDLFTALKAVAQVFDFGGLENQLLQTSIRDPKDYYPENLYEQGVATYPEWTLGNLGNVGALRRVNRGMQGFLNSSRANVDRAQAFSKMAGLIAQRIATLEARLKNILDVLNALANLATLPVSYLTMYGPSNIDGIKAGLRSAPFLQTYPLGKPEVEMCGAICFHAVLGAGRSLDFLRALFGIRDKAVSTWQQSIVTNAVDVKTAYETATETQQSTAGVDVVWNGSENDQ